MNIANDTIAEMRLYDLSDRRLYVNAAERRRFHRAAMEMSPETQSFCLTLLFTGCRISEALALKGDAVQIDARVLTVRTLKRRRIGVYREVPIAPALATALELQCANTRPDHPLWERRGRPVDRITAYRWVKQVMRAANINGVQACPKGLRHGFGIHAIQSGVPLNMLQKWMGHASMSTTAIYANAMGADELAIADRMWRGKK